MSDDERGLAELLSDRAELDLRNQAHITNLAAQGCLVDAALGVAIRLEVIIGQLFPDDIDRARFECYYQGELARELMVVEDQFREAKNRSQKRHPRNGRATEKKLYRPGMSDG